MVEPESAGLAQWVLSSGLVPLVALIAAVIGLMGHIWGWQAKLERVRDRLEMLVRLLENLQAQYHRTVLDVETIKCNVAVVQDKELVYHFPQITVKLDGENETPRVWLTGGEQPYGQVAHGGGL